MKMTTKGDRMRTRTLFLLLLICYATAFAQSAAQAGRWTEQQTNDWYKKQPWLVGCNYNPMNGNSYGSLEPKNKVELVETLLPQVFAWARAARPQQPLTAGVWKGDWSSEEKMTSIDKTMIALSDIVSFHSYEDGAKLETRI